MTGGAPEEKAATFMAEENAMLMKKEPAEKCAAAEEVSASANEVVKDDVRDPPQTNARVERGYRARGGQFP